MKYKRCTEELKADKNWKWRQAQLWKRLYMPFEEGGAWSHIKEGIPLELLVFSSSFFFFLNKGSRIYLNFYLFYVINMVLRLPLRKIKTKHLEYQMNSSKNAEILERWLIIIQFSSVAQSCPALCEPMNCSTPGLPVHYQFPEFTQIHVHWVGDAIQQSHPLSSCSPPAFNLSQH